MKHARCTFIIFAIISSLIALPQTINAQDEDLFPGGTYDPDIPTPLETTGHRFGELHTFHWEMERFLEAVDAASPRVQVFSYGETYQGRTLYYVIISDPANMERLEEIREANLQLADPRTTSAEEAERIAEWMPSLVWLGYNIHGNEASAMEAAIRTIYQLAAGTDEATRTILKNTVCFIDPVQNPDGHERFTHYVRSVVTVQSNPDPLDIEHSSPWPGGRTNHYLFDLNRDFFLKTQVESRGRAKIIHHWRPHVYADLHEMGSNATYFFAPPMTPYNQFARPEVHKWWRIFGDANAEAFDFFGWGYYTRESFDAFYPGYGTSYPTINGAIGMTYEQGSARSVSTTRDDGYVLTLREAAWHHFTTSMATLKATASRRSEKILDFYRFFANALEDAEDDPIKEIILVPRNDPHIAAKLIDNLLVEKVEIRRATEPFTAKNATSYLTKEQKTVSLPEGSYLIRLAQPQTVLIKALLAPDSPLSEEFIEEERQRKANRESSHFYDVTAWSMPLTFGVESYWTSSISDVATEPVSAAPEIPGSVIGGRAGQVYLIPFNTLAASKMLGALCKEDFRVRIARKPFTIEGNEWPRGTLVVRANRNPESLHERIAELAQKFGVAVAATGTGLSEAGIDLGSNNVVTIKKPKIALLTESPVSAYSYGTLHYLFEREFELPFTRVNASNMGDLENFNVVIMPSGNYRNLLSERQLNNFKEWVNDGGTVIAISGALGWLRSEQVGLSELALLNGTPHPDNPDEMISPDRTPGAIVRVNLNQRSYLSWGCPPALAALVRSSTIYTPFEDEVSKNIGLFAPLEKLRLSGFIWPETEPLLAGGGFLFEEAVGRGKIISFTEDPTFRASYDGLSKLLLNAVLLGPSL